MYGWFIHVDDSKTNLPSYTFAPSSSGTIFYQHDDSNVFRTTIQLCPWQAQFPWMTEFEGHYYKLNKMGISMTLSCIDSQNLHTVEILAPASYATDCNNYGVDKILIDKIEDTYEEIFEAFEPRLTPLGEIPFYICVGFHVFGCIVLAVLGLWPVWKAPKGSFSRHKAESE